MHNENVANELLRTQVMLLKGAYDILQWQIGLSSLQLQFESPII